MPDDIKDHLEKCMDCKMEVLEAGENSNPKYIFQQPYEHQRKVVESAFAGKDAQGQRMGIYMEETDDPNTPWKFEIRGLVESTVLSLPLTDEYLEEAFNLDPYYQDIDKELENIKTSFRSYKPTVCNKNHTRLPT